MSSKRTLKKEITHICSDIVGEALLLGEFCPEEKQDALGQLIIDVAVLQQNALSNCSFAFDKSQREFPTAAAYQKAKTAYFKQAFTKLRADFSEGINKALHTLNEIAGLSK